VNIRKNLADAHIKRVAIIDDDLSEAVSTKNLQQVNRHLEALLADESDPDHQAYLQVIKNQGYNPDDRTDLAQWLSEQRVRDEAPEQLRKAAEDVLTSRRSQAEPVQRVIRLLLESGINESDIETFYNSEIPDGQRFDLVIVDYYLENDSKGETVPLIKRIIENHAEQDRQIQLILMSSYEERLKQDFHELRPYIQASSSRIRILAKPQDDTQLAGWKLTLEQLATDRSYVNFIERFVKQAIDTIKRAADERSGKLWELDLQAMKVLHATARADNDDFVRYVEECLGRYLLTRLEESCDLRKALERLREEFEQKDDTSLVSVSAEVCDSHDVIREVMSSMVWRGGGAPIVPNKPANPADGSEWTQSFLRFGMVLQDCNGRLWLNLTQSCDLAQAKADELDNLSLLFVSGQISPTMPGKNIVSMNAPMAGAGSDLVSWNLQRISTPSVSEFANAFNNGWSAVGELRQDQAQHVIAIYGARATRVGLQRAVRSWKMCGVALKNSMLQKAADDAAIEYLGLPVNAHLLLHNKDYRVYFDLLMYNSLQAKFSDEIGAGALRICKGVAVNPGKASQGEPYLIHLHCKTAPTNIKELRGLIDDKYKQFLKEERNANKIIVVVWPAQLIKLS